MQRIERYGVIALVLLLVTIVAVTFWEKADVGGASEREQSEARKLVARVETGSEAARGAAHITPTGPARAIDRDLPVTDPNDSVASKPVDTPEPKPVQPPAETKRPRDFPDPIASRGGRAGSSRSGTESNQWSISERGMDHDENGRLFRAIETPEDRRDSGEEEPSTVSSAPSETSDFAAEMRGGEIGAEELEPGPAGSELAALDPAEDRAKRDSLAEMKRIADEKRAAERAREQAKPTTVRSYVVQPGDSLSQISTRFLGTRTRMKEIQTLNGIEDPSKIRSGMTLRLPDGALAQAGTTPPPSSSRVSPIQNTAQVTRNTTRPPAAKGTYVVKKGDMLSVIAERELGSSKRWREIAALNPKVDPDRLFENTVLRMPSGPATRSTAPSTPPKRSRNTAVAQAKATAPRRSSDKNRVR